MWCIARTRVVRRRLLQFATRIVIAGFHVTRICNDTLLYITILSFVLKTKHPNLFHRSHLWTHFCSYICIQDSQLWANSRRCSCSCLNAYNALKIKLSYVKKSKRNTLNLNKYFRNQLKHKVKYFPKFSAWELHSKNSDVIYVITKVKTNRNYRYFHKKVGYMNICSMALSKLCYISLSNCMDCNNTHLI